MPNWPLYSSDYSNWVKPYCCKKMGIYAVGSENNIRLFFFLLLYPWILVTLQLMQCANNSAKDNEVTPGQTHSEPELCNAGSICLFLTAHREQTCTKLYSVVLYVCGIRGQLKQWGHALRTYCLVEAQHCRG